MRAYIGGLALLALALPAAAQERRAITFEDFAGVRAVADPQLSPDGRQVLYVVRTTDVAANRRTGVTLLAPVDGGAARRWPDDTTRASEARWSPDGRLVAYVAGGQLWVADASGGNRRKLTALSTGASGPVWSPTGEMLAVVSGVYADCADDACNARRADSVAKHPVKAVVTERLMFRHWMAYDPGTRSHLFVVRADGAGAPRDLTAGVTYDVPPGPFGGSEAYRFSPDGRELTYSAKLMERDEAWSTDVNLYAVAVDGGKPAVLTAANRGADQNPAYSPDGRWLSYASQRRAGFESDRWRLMLRDRRTGATHELLPAWDRNADAWWFAPDMSALYVATQDRGRDKLYRVGLRDGRAVGTPQLVLGEHNNLAFSFSGDLRTVAWLRDAAHRPAEVHVARLDAQPVVARPLTRENEALVARLALNPAEDYWFRGADGDSVHGFVIKPPQWRAGQKFPVVVLIHGGPQGAFLDQWHSRWNYQMFASPGYGVVILNPRGSTGYGQRFVDQVSRDWGGRVYRDIMLGVDAALRRHAWLDSTRMGAAGGSYGGYMMNWINGHTNRFDALVTHAGLFNLESMYGATEELWFTDWEFGQPWDPTALRTQYRRFSPHLHAPRMKTPTLVVHGELDYRVPYTEGLQLFTALQRHDVPSRLLLYPDEGHWIAKPQNQRLWWSEVLGWFGRYLEKPKA